VSIKVFYSHGKLLLTGEYLVLDSAKALALPTQKGQYLTVKKSSDSKIKWKSFDEVNNVWFEEEFELQNLKSTKTTNTISRTLLDIVLAAQCINPEFLASSKGVYVTTKLTFSRQFGLGSSSTLIANIAQWAEVNPYQLLWNSFKGSGYDIACAFSDTALVYQLKNSLAKVTPVSFNPSFKHQLYFVYLNKKQDSKDGISHYRTLPVLKKEAAITRVNAITLSLLQCETLLEFETLLQEHEVLLSNVLQLPTVKSRLFNDYNGQIKSLGAWGGDFVLITVKELSDLNYFNKKGYTTIIGFDEMILS
jgi:mevalonate kinase